MIVFKNQQHRFFLLLQLDIMFCWLETHQWTKRK